MARRDRESRSIKEALDLLERGIQSLKTEYEMYFMGLQKLAPDKQNRDLKRTVRELTELRIQNTALQFRLRVLRARYNTLSTYWHRSCRQIEEGTYTRHRVMADLRARRRSPAESRDEAMKIRDQIRALIRGDEPGETQAAHPTAGAAGGGPDRRKTGRRGRQGSGHAVGSDALLKEYSAVREQLGASGSVNRAALEQRLRKHAETVKQKTGCSEVRFQVVAEGGRARVKAIPIE